MRKTQCRLLKSDDEKVRFCFIHRFVFDLSMCIEYLSVEEVFLDLKLENSANFTANNQFFHDPRAKTHIPLTELRSEILHLTHFNS